MKPRGTIVARYYSTRQKVPIIIIKTTILPMMRHGTIVQYEEFNAVGTQASGRKQATEK